MYSFDLCIHGKKFRIFFLSSVTCDRLSTQELPRWNHVIEFCYYFLEIWLYFVFEGTRSGRREVSSPSRAGPTTRATRTGPVDSLPTIPPSRRHRMPSRRARGDQSSRSNDRNRSWRREEKTRRKPSEWPREGRRRRAKVANKYMFIKFLIAFR